MNDIDCERCRQELAAALGVSPLKWDQLINIVKSQRRQLDEYLEEEDDEDDEDDEVDDGA